MTIRIELEKKLKLALRVELRGSEPRLVSVKQAEPASFLSSLGQQTEPFRLMSCTILINHIIMMDIDIQRVS
jgi:hypothetical protein